MMYCHNCERTFDERDLQHVEHWNDGSSELNVDLRADSMYSDKCPNCGSTNYEEAWDEYLVYSSEFAEDNYPEGDEEDSFDDYRDAESYAKVMEQTDKYYFVVIYRLTGRETGIIEQEEF